MRVWGLRSLKVNCDNDYPPYVTENNLVKVVPESLKITKNLYFSTQCSLVKQTKVKSISIKLTV